MSRISEMMKRLQEMDEELEHIEKRKVAVTVRLGDQTTWRLDFLAKTFGSLRSNFARDFIEESAVEAMEALGYDMDTQFEMYINDRKAQKEAE